MKTTTDHFDFFAKSILRYCDKSRMVGWDIRIRHILVENGYSSCRVDVAARVVEFALTSEWNDEVWELDDERLDYCARHEVGHFFMWRVFDLAERRYVTQNEMDSLDEEMAIRIAELLV